MESTAKFSEPHAIGCIIGAFVADACGSLVEFSPKEFPKQSDLETILSMPGGGPWKLSPG